MKKEDKQSGMVGFFFSYVISIECGELSYKNNLAHKRRLDCLKKRLLLVNARCENTTNSARVTGAWKLYDTRACTDCNAVLE